MKRYLLSGALAVSSLAAAGEPVIVELQPRGAERGKPFVLTISGRELGEAAKIVSTLPASFTPMAPDPKMARGNRYASFLVEPKADASVGAYAVRVQTKDGISNVLLFTVGTFPETSEEESEPGKPMNSNDTIESAQPLQSAPLVVNGKLTGAERDVFRVSGKAGERRVFEVEARRAGSAIDPVIRILDPAGNMLARSEDAPGIGLDARLDFTFPRDGNYYVEVHDARYSAQEQNFYRLKMGSYAYAEDLFPLGGKRGQVVDVSLSGTRLAKPVVVSANLAKTRETDTQVWVNLPDSPTLPLPFAIGEFPEVMEATGANVLIPVPGVVNGRLGKPGEIDTYKVAVKPGVAMMLEMQAREMGTSKIIGLVTVRDPKGKELARAGDEPLVEGLFGAQSLTARDPFVRFKVPEGVGEVTVTVEDLAQRGGPGYAYRLMAREQAEDFTAAIGNPYVNIPRGGTARIIVTVDRRGIDGPIQFTIPNLPAGLTADGGLIPAEGDRSSGGSKVFSRRGVIALTAKADLKYDGELEVWAEGKASDGTILKRRAKGYGTQIAVNGAVTQGAVDRQRTIQSPWMGMQLPAAVTAEPAAKLVVTQVDRKREAEGDRYQFTWKWDVRPGAEVIRPNAIAVDIAGINDVRIIDVMRDAKDPMAGSFVITTTKVTMPSLYDLVASGRVMFDGVAEEIFAKPIRLEVMEFKPNEAAPATGNSGN